MPFVMPRDAVRIAIWITCSLLVFSDVFPIGLVTLWRRNVWSLGSISFGLDHLAMFVLAFCGIYLVALNLRRPSLSPLQWFFAAVLASGVVATAVVLLRLASHGESMISQRTTIALCGLVVFATWQSRPPRKWFPYLLVAAGLLAAASVSLTKVVDLGGLGPVEAWTQSDNWIYASRSYVAVAALVLPVSIIAALTLPTKRPRTWLGPTIAAVLSIGAALSLVRTVWLGCAIAFLVMSGLLLTRPRCGRTVTSGRRSIVVGISITALVFLVSLVAVGAVHERAGSTARTSGGLVATDSPNPPIASQSAQSGMEAASTASTEWRIGVWREVITDTGLTLLPVRPITTLRGHPFLGSHNGYVEAYRTFGLLGSAVLLTGMVMAFVRARNTFFLLSTLITMQVVLLMWDGIVWPWIAVGCALATRTVTSVQARRNVEELASQRG